MNVHLDRQDAIIFARIHREVSIVDVDQDMLSWDLMFVKVRISSI